MAQKVDPLSGNKFTPLRINQRFENRMNRTTFWNNHSNKLRHTKSQYDKPLHKNYLILLKLLDNKKEASFHKQFLLGNGYSFEVYTHLEDYKGKSCFAIYEFIVLTDDSDNIKFVRND